MAPDFNNVVGDSVPIASSIRAEVDAAINTLNQKLREVNRKVVPRIWQFLHLDCPY